MDLVVTGTIGASLVLLSPTEATAEELEGILNQMLDTGQEITLAQLTSQMTSDDPVQQAMAQYSERVTRRMFETF